MLLSVRSVWSAFLAVGVVASPLVAQESGGLGRPPPGPGNTGAEVEKAPAGAAPVLEKIPRPGGGVGVTRLQPPPGATAPPTFPASGGGREGTTVAPSKPEHSTTSTDGPADPARSTVSDAVGVWRATSMPPANGRKWLFDGPDHDGERPLWLRLEAGEPRAVPKNSALYEMLGPDSAYLVEQIVSRPDRRVEIPRESLTWPIPVTREYCRPGYFPRLRSEQMNPGGYLRPFGGH